MNYLQALVKYAAGDRLPNLPSRQSLYGKPATPPASPPQSIARAASSLSSLNQDQDKKGAAELSRAFTAAGHHTSAAILDNALRNYDQNDGLGFWSHPIEPNHPDLRAHVFNNEGELSIGATHRIGPKLGVTVFSPVPDQHLNSVLEGLKAEGHVVPDQKAIDRALMERDASRLRNNPQPVQGGSSVVPLGNEKASKPIVASSPSRAAKTNLGGRPA